MTIDELRAIPRSYLLPIEVASILECTPQLIRNAARTKPQTLGFPVVVVGRRTKIPKLPFIAFMEGKAAVEKVRE